jgi:ubiquinone/menaquinone biosynthesis C-methylase UbiE
MGGNLPEMGTWDSIFDETYFRTYAPLTDEERTRTEALGAAALAGLAAGAEVLDCPCGFGRHALVLAAEGYRVTGVDRSPSQLKEAERRRGDREWPRLARADYRDLPFDDASFDGVLTLFTSLGYLERGEDVGVLRELRRVLRPDGALVVETMHRDGLARFYAQGTSRRWQDLPDDAIYLEESEPDWVTGTVSGRHLVVTPEHERIERRYVLHVYSIKEWVEMLREAGFEHVYAFGGWDETKPAAPEIWRLVLRAR